MTAPETDRIKGGLGAILTGIQADYSWECYIDRVLASGAETMIEDDDC
jgi:hypothetical protein